MQISKINSQVAIMNNRPKTQNQKSNVSFGTLSEGFEKAFGVLLRNSGFDAINSIKPEAMDYLRKHPVLFDILKTDVIPYGEQRIQRSDYFIAECPIVDQVYPRLKLFQYQDKPSSMINQAVRLAQQFDAIKKPQSQFTKEMAEKYSSIESSIPKIKDILKLLKINELMPANKRIEEYAFTKERLETELSELNEARTEITWIQNSDKEKSMKYNNDIFELFPNYDDGNFRIRDVRG